MNTSRIVFGLDYIVNGWFEENFHKLKQGRYVAKEDGLCNFSKIFRFNPSEGDLGTFILEKE